MKKLVITFALIALFSSSFSQTSPSSQQVGSYDWKIQSGGGTMATPSTITLDGDSDNYGGSILLEAGPGYNGPGKITVKSQGGIFLNGGSSNYYTELDISDTYAQRFTTNSNKFVFGQPVTVEGEFITEDD